MDGDCGALTGDLDIVSGIVRDEKILGRGDIELLGEGIEQM
jgi:hypothetical protein